MDVKLNLGDVTFVYKIVVRIFLVDVDSNINIIVYWKGIRIQCNYHSHRRLHHSHQRLHQSHPPNQYNHRRHHRHHRHHHRRRHRHHRHHPLHHRRHHPLHPLHHRRHYISRTVTLSAHQICHDGGHQL